MESILKRSKIFINQVSTDFKRAMFYDIPWQKRLIAIKGARGVGKTTLVLQFLKENYNFSDEAVYISMDDPYFYKTSLFDFGEKFRQNGGKILVVDEVHKYINWSKEVKLLYDLYKDLQIIITGSSILQLYKGEADLSRRMLIFDMQGLSFREFLQMKYNFKMPQLKLEDILNNFKEISSEIFNKIQYPLKYFSEYLKTGYYPFFVEDDEPVFYYQRINQIVNLILTADLPSIIEVNNLIINKLQKLLVIIAQSSPFKPNISKIAQNLNVTRETLYRYLFLLERSSLVKSIFSNTKGIHQLTKPDKLFLENPNLFFAIAEENVNKGSLRETFFLNQVSYKHKVNYPKTADFLVDDKYLFEIGGKTKTRKQIAEQDNAFVVADDIEIGFGNKIPLWLFGFLY